MYGKYIDNMTGQEVNNPFIPYLHNESMLKLKYDNKWYDLIIKSSTENSTNNSYNYSASDLHINELSKNGFNLVMDQTLNNNCGTLTELGQYVLKDTNWDIDIENSHCSVQTIEEGLVKLRTSQTIHAYLIDDTKVDEGKGLLTPTYANIPENTVVYGFYSSCKNKPHRF
jgi:hypothetical protein